MDLKEHYDFILDEVGKRKNSELKDKLKNVLSEKGKYLSVDNGTPMATLDNLKFLMQLVLIGQLKTVIDKTFPLEQIVDAHRYVDAGHKKGNVIITV
jgi:NADPH:quinone reductase-like Zn-dependent oxidoreductase